MAQKRDIYQEVTDKIVAAIEAGASGDHWELPWVGVGRGPAENATTGATYRGINHLLLGLSTRAGAYRSNIWATFKQWQSKGCQVKKGEKGTPIVVYKDRVFENEKENGEVEEKVIPLIRYYYVFNADQVEGFELPSVELPNLAQRLEACERFVDATAADIRFDQGRAFYRPMGDFIGMPAWEAFKETKASSATENAYSTLFHELTHWTGAKHRLDRDRDFSGRFGNQAYAAEELVAELGAAMLCTQLQVAHEPRPDHAQFIASWLKVLRKDKKAIFTAAAKAAAAVDHLNQLQSDGPRPAPKGPKGETAGETTRLRLRPKGGGASVTITMRTEATRAEIEAKAARSNLELLAVLPAKEHGGRRRASAKPAVKPAPQPARLPKAARPLLEAAPQMLQTLKAVERAFGRSARVERLSCFAAR